MARSQSNTDKTDDNDKTDEGGEPKSSEPTASGPVLYALHRGGPYTASRYEKVATKHKGAGKEDPLERLVVLTMRLLPGLNLVDRATFDKVKAGKGLNARIDAMEIEALAGFGRAQWRDEWKRIKPAKCVELIEGTSDIATMQAILEGEERPEVADALQEQIAACRGKSVQAQQVRSARRTFNRRGVAVGRRGR